MTFDDWWMTLLPAEIDELKVVFEECWNAAIDQAAVLVAEHYDPCEPWITPQDVRALKTSSDGGEYADD